jgi:hypothetical protein
MNVTFSHPSQVFAKFVGLDWIINASLFGYENHLFPRCPYR